MKALYIHENFYYRQGGAEHVYSAAQFGYEYWDAYRQHFSHLTIVGRDAGLVKQGQHKHYNLSSGKGVSFALMPNLSGPRNLIKNRREVKEKLAALIAEHDAVILRNANEICWLAYFEARKQGKAVAVEMTGCQWDAMWHFVNPLAKFYAPIRHLQGRYLAWKADAIIYVSKEFLQGRYPSKAPQAYASNVRIQKPSAAVLTKRLKRIEKAKTPYRIGLIGALHHGLKGIDVAIDAMAKMLKRSPDLATLHILGHGDPSIYDAQIEKRGLKGKIIFEGVLPSGAPVHKWLDSMDLYIQPSFHEGVPRATIEAMSRACPVLGSECGGIPELIPEGWTHKPGHVAKLADDMERLLQDRRTQVSHAKKSFKKAMQYTADKLEPRRQKFWSQFMKFAKKKSGK